MKNCEWGCSHYTCGSIGHIKECVNYPESLQELLDTSKAGNEALKHMLLFLVENDSINDSSIEKEVIALLKSK